MTQRSIDVVLVRHGQSIWNAERRYQGQAGPGLTDLGHAQARRVAEALAEAVPDVHSVVSSDLPRVRETVAPYLAATGREALFDARWREIDIGTWAGLLHDEIERSHPEDLAAWERGEDIARGGGESFADLHVRVRGAVESLVAGVAASAPAGDVAPVLVFTHGGPMRMAAADALGLAPARFRWMADPANCSITRVRHVIADGAIVTSELLDHDLRADELAARRALV